MSDCAGIQLQERFRVGSPPLLGRVSHRLDGHCRGSKHGALVGIRSDQHRDIGLLSFGIDVVDIFRQAPAVHDRTCVAAGCSNESGAHCGLKFLGRLRAQLGERAEFGSCLFGLSQAFHRLELAAAFSDHSMEQAARQRTGREQVGAPRAGGFAEYRDAPCVATERRDILLNPSERGDLIEQTVIARSGAVRFLAQFRMGKETKHAQAVVDGHYHNALPGQLFAIIDGARTGCKSATVDPHHYRKLVARRFGGGVDIQVQTVFAHRGLRAYAGRIGPSLHAYGGKLRCIANAGPFRGDLRRPPAQIRHRGCGEGHALKYSDFGCSASHTGKKALLDPYGFGDGSLEGQHKGKEK